VNATLKGKKLILEMDVRELRPSSTKKSLIVAMTGGHWQSPAQLDGEPIWIFATAYIKKRADSDSKAQKTKTKVTTRAAATKGKPGPARSGGEDPEDS
jgi:hypothetical protein